MSHTVTVEGISEGLVSEKRSGFIVGREKSPEDIARRKEITGLKSALSGARKVFAQEASAVKGKKKDSELASFVAYESALNNYLTFIMNTQGLQMAEVARIGERDFLGAVDRAKNPKKFWGAVVGGGSFIALTAPLQTVVGVAAGLVMNKVYTPVSRYLSDEVTWGTSKVKIEKREQEAREASRVGLDFKTFTGSDNLLDKHLGSKFKAVTDKVRRDRYARLMVSMLTAGGTFFATGAGLSSNLIHDQIGNISAADWLTQHGMGWLVHGFRPEIAAGASAIVGSSAHAAELVTNTSEPKVMVAGVDVLNAGKFNFAEGPAAPAPEQAPDVISRLGSAPFAGSRVEAFSALNIEKAADGAVRGGMRPEFRDEFVAALRAQATVTKPDMTTLGPRQSFEWMLGRGGSVLGVGDKDVVLDTTRVAIPGAKTAVLSYPAERFSFTAEASDGSLHRITIVRADECNNFAQLSDEVISRPPAPVPPVEFIPPPQPPAEVPPPQEPPHEWFLKRNPIVSDCESSCSKVTNAYLILDSSTRSVPDAQEYLRDSILGVKRDGVDSLLPKGYQSNIRTPFVLERITDPVTGKVTYWCMDAKTGHFSHPFISENGKTSVVDTEAEWQRLINGEGNVVDPKDPIFALIPVDTDRNGTVDTLKVRASDVPPVQPPRL